MKVRMLKTQDSPKYGALIKGREYDLEPVDERRFIERGVAINISAPEYVSKSKRKSNRKK